MTEYFWPQDIGPSRQTYGLVDLTSIFSSPLTGTTRTVSRPGRLMRCRMEFENLNAALRHRVLGLLGALTRADRIWIPDFSTALRGSFPATELLANTTFPNTTGWASSNAEVVLTAESGRMRLTRTGVLGDRVISAPGTTTTGVTYLIRAGMLAGRGGARWSVVMGSGAGLFDIASGSTQTAGSLAHGTGVASGSTTYGGVKDFAATRAAEHFQILDSPSLSRCILVKGGSQTGSALIVDALPTSTLGLLLVGDVFSVYTTRWEPKRVVANLDSNSAGEGYLQFEPPLRSSPADNAPIAVYRPMSRFILASDEVSWETRGGLFSDFSLEFVEDVA